jgi:ABC-type multidrug transport system fused ATPase/permease subunit
MLGISFAGSLAAVALLHRLRPQIQSLQQRWIELAGANAALRNIRTILDRSDKVYLPAGDQTFTRLAREIRFENVTMRYPGAPRAALDSVSFTVPAGPVSAVVGLSLSNGQRQRVRLARALLRDPDILILDEAMSALDAARENRIRWNIEERFRNRTIVLITHRLETVLGVDDLVCIDEGQVFGGGVVWPRGAVEPPPGALRRFLQGARPETVASKLRAHDRW